MRKLINLSGKTFGRLLVIERAPNKGKRTMWKCICSCKDKTVCICGGEKLKRGETRSCGCIRKETLYNRSTKHGGRYIRLYTIWNSMKQRCYNSNNSNYHIYGAEGKTVCDEWKNDFQAFYDWAIANGYREDLTIERIDGTKGYSPENCRWATRKEQANNTRRNRLITYNGKTQNIKQLADEVGINYSVLKSRLNKMQWDIEKALNTPVK